MISASDSRHDGGGFSFPDMTVLLDVIFILLVFLLLTANTVPQALEVALPQAGSEQASALESKQPLTITIFADADRWGVSQREFENWEAFEHALGVSLKANPEPDVIVAGDRDVPLEKLLTLFAWLQSHNLSAAQVLIQH